MRASICMILMGILLMGESVAHDDEPLPKDHSIYLIPDNLDSRTRTELSRIRNQKDPVWKFKLVKERFLVGETIWGVLSVENRERFSFTFSPPYRGFHVATIGIWVSRQSDQNDNGRWEPLKEIFTVNQGYSNKGRSIPAHEQLPGKPITLKPGEKFQAMITINGDYDHSFEQPLSHLHGLEWFGGVGFSKPGKYRFYIQYVNLEETIDFESRDGVPKGANPQDGDNPLLSLPIKPIVLGPFEVEVVAAKKTMPKEFTANLEQWDKLHAKIIKERKQQGSNGVSYVSFGPDFDLTKLLADENVRAKEMDPVRFSLLLTQIHCDISKLSEKNKEEKTKALTKILKRLQESNATVSEGPLKDAYTLTECHVLYGLDKKDEALKLAKKLGTPDAEVFIYDVENGIGKKK